jgi:glycosyltransferase involved in cell wall biosynthesis
MAHVLFLTARMLRGYGVDLAVHELANALTRRGHNVTVAAANVQQYGRRAYVLHCLPAQPSAVIAYVEALRPDVVVAHTSPYYEMLPELCDAFPVYAWEYGDPPPHLFNDCDKRQRVKDGKKQEVYPVLHGVAAISRFIADDCGWPRARVIYCGCDHVPNHGPKPRSQQRKSNDGSVLRIGTLMRFGTGEARYKGHDEFVQLVRRLRAAGVQAEFQAMGRGTPEDAALFHAAGIRTHLNASDAAKVEYLRRLDVFVSLSRWEGFNLPLAEAQALGTLGVALRMGAHEEVSPNTFTDMEAIQSCIETCYADRAVLHHAAELGYHHVQGRFKWSVAAEAWADFMALNDAKTEPPSILKRLSTQFEVHKILLHTRGKRAFVNDLLARRRRLVQ